MIPPEPAGHNLIKNATRNMAMQTKIRYLLLADVKSGNA